MRRLADAHRVRNFMRLLGQRAQTDGRVYFTGGTTALLIGWRATTNDIDLALGADTDHLLRLVPALKEELELNVELASPSDFIPELPDWRDRSRFIGRQGQVDFFHYDFYAQALSKLGMSRSLLKLVRADGSSAPPSYQATWRPSFAALVGTS